MTIAITETSFRVIDLETRLPFHFGTIEITAIPKVFLRVDVTVDGEAYKGIAMGGLIPGWFFKDPEMALETGYRNMIEVFRRTATISYYRPGSSRRTDAVRFLAVVVLSAA